MLSARLPTELLDHIADLLHDTGEALTNCCLISKSWIPRTRRHIFADVAFLTDEDLESWKETFPDPSKSPAHYTKNLSIDYLRVKVAEGEGDRWIGGFSRVVHLKVVALGKEGASMSWQSLLLFHGFPRSHPSFDPLHDSSHPSVVSDFRPRPFIPTSREPDHGHQQSGYRQYGWSRWDTDRRPPTPTHDWVSCALSAGRAEASRTSVAIPTRRHPLPSPRFGVVLGGRFVVGSHDGGGVFSDP